MITLSSCNKTHPISHVNEPLDKTIPTKASSEDMFRTLFLNPSHSPEEKAKLKARISKIPPEQLKLTLYTIFREECSKKTTNNLFASVHYLASLVTKEQLEAAIRTMFPDFKDALTTAKSMFHEASYFLSQTKTGAPSPQISWVTHCIESLQAALETLLSVFGVEGFFHPTESSSEADSKFQRISSLINFFYVLTTAIVPFVGDIVGGLVIGATFLIIGVASSLYPQLKGAPSYLPKAINWSKQARDGILPRARGRESLLKKIRDSLVLKSSPHSHPLLIGKPGIGKTHALQALTYAIEEGNYKELKGKQVFYIHTSSLQHDVKKFGGKNQILSALSKAMGAYRTTIILILDDLHLAFQDQDSSGMSSQLKILLDEGAENFPYVIGVTTDDKYMKNMSMKNCALAHRFTPIFVKETTPAETETIASDFLLRHAPTLTVEDDAIAYLVKRVEECFDKRTEEPSTSLRILTGCLKQATKAHLLEEEIHAEEAQNLKEALVAKQTLSSKSLLTQDSASHQALHALESKIQELARQADEKRTQYAQLETLQKQLFETKKAFYHAAVHIHTHATDRLQLTPYIEEEFLILKAFMQPALHEQLQATAQQYHLSAGIDKNLIDEVLTKDAKEQMSLHHKDRD